MSRWGTKTSKRLAMISNFMQVHRVRGLTMACMSSRARARMPRRVRPVYAVLTSVIDCLYLLARPRS
eukprot:12221082-Alexandrium_andersonii.AAC.1